MANLYDLPKDMLVKLVATIRDETIKEFEFEQKRIIDKILNEEGWYDECCVENCESIVVSGIYDDIKISKTHRCDNCHKVYCIKHIDLKNNNNCKSCVNK